VANKPLISPRWPKIIEGSTLAFIGEARLVHQEQITPTEITLFGYKYRLTVEIHPEQALFGSLPDVTLLFQGETELPPDQRKTLYNPQFPPDILRIIAFWDYALPDTTQPVLVVQQEPAILRLLSGPDDDLLDAIRLIHHWTKLSEAEQQRAVLDDLAKPGQSPVAYLGGFQLLMDTTSDLPGLFKTFTTLPDVPGASVQGIVDELYWVSLELSQHDIERLARQLLNGWSQENYPAALSSYMLWFSAYGQWTWQKDQRMKEEILAQLKRTRNLSFSGPYAKAWEQQVYYYASSILALIES
jgi:hypothetical protein